MSSDVPGNLKNSAKMMLDSKNEINEYIDNNNLKPKDKVNLEYLSKGLDSFSGMANSMSSEMKKVLNGDMSDSEFKDKIDKLIDNEEMSKVGEDFDKALAYFETKGVKSNTLEEIFSDTTSEETDEEVANDEEINTDDPDGDGYASDLVDTFKVDKPIDLGPATFTITKVETATEPVTEDNLYNFNGYKIGEKAQLIIVYMKLKNNTEQNVDYYADQYPIVTDTGEQLDPADFNYDTGLVTEMKGAVESEGRVVYLLKNSNIKDVKHITFIAPSYNDPETMDEITPEQKIEIPLSK